MHSGREVFNEGSSLTDSRAFTVDESELLEELHLPNTGLIPSPAEARRREYSVLPLQQFQVRPMVRHEEAPMKMDTTEDPGPVPDDLPAVDPPVVDDYPYWSDVVMRDAGAVEMRSFPGCVCRIQQITPKIGACGNLGVILLLWGGGSGEG